MMMNRMRVWLQSHTNVARRPLGRYLHLAFAFLDQRRSSSPDDDIYGDTDGEKEARGN
jgi:hypothetical protein